MNNKKYISSFIDPIDDQKINNETEESCKIDLDSESSVLSLTQTDTQTRNLIQRWVIDPLKLVCFFGYVSVFVIVGANTATCLRCQLVRSSDLKIVYEHVPIPSVVHEYRIIPINHFKSEN